MNYIQGPRIKLACGGLQHTWYSTVYYQKKDSDSQTMEYSNIPNCPECGCFGWKIEEEEVTKTKSVIDKLTKFVNLVLGRILVFKEE